VVEKFRRLGWRKREVDFDGVPLTGADTRAVIAERKTLFVILRDDALQKLARQLTAAGAYETKQFVHVGPAVLVERQPNLLRLVPQNKAEKLAGFDQIG